LNGAVVTLQPVVEVAARDAARPAPWPVAGRAPLSRMPLTGASSPQDAALFVADLVRYVDAPDGGDLIDALIAEETITAEGGLRAHDAATGVTIEPGCCAELEDWRSWLDLRDGKAPWLGHSPLPTPEFIGDTVRLWQDDDRATTSVDFAAEDLPAMLAGARRDLAGFLDVVRLWAGRRGPALAATLDRHFSVTRPLT
jgi:hypothetical protein